MDTKILVKEITVNNQIVSLFVQGQAPIIEYDNQRFINVWLLVDHLKELTDQGYIDEFSEISNFFWKGTQFQFIRSISEYQQNYQDRIELEQRHTADVFEYRLTDFKIFDVSVMHEPKVENGQLSYYVYNVSNGLPYRVVCPFPYTASTSTFVHYQLLPILN